MSEYEMNECNFIGSLFSITPNPLKGAMPQIKALLACSESPL
jgi:hypothetical protein